MAHEIESIAWSGEVPWHGIGHKVDPTVTVDEMLVAAGLDWEITKERLYTKVDGKEIRLPDRRVLMRSSDQKIMSICSALWKPLQNKDALGFFRDYTFAGGATLETAGALKGGKVVWGLANLGHGFTLRGGDEVKGYLLLVSPHEVGKSILLSTTSVRVVCANTLRAAINSLGDAAYSQNHLSEFDVSKAKETIGLCHADMTQLEIDAKALMQLKMSQYDTVRFLARFFAPEAAQEIEGSKGRDQKKVVDALLDPANQPKHLQQVMQAVSLAPGALPDNAWGVLNGVTYWADHLAGNKQESRLANSWLGAQAKQKLEVKAALLEMAK